MQVKLSKHFIYQWLHEDAYGEFLLHASKNNVFTQKLLLKAWKFLLFKSNTFQGIASVFAPRFASFTVALIRKRFLHKYINNFSLYSIENLILLTEGKNYTWFKLFFLNNLFCVKLLRLQTIQKMYKLRKKNIKNTNYQKIENKKKTLKKFSWARYIFFLRRRRKLSFINRKKKVLVVWKAQKHNLRSFCKLIKKRSFFWKKYTTFYQGVTSNKKVVVRRRLLSNRKFNRFYNKRKSPYFVKSTLKNYFKWGVNFFKSIKNYYIFKKKHLFTSVLWRFWAGRSTPILRNKVSFVKKPLLFLPQKLQSLVQKQLLFKVWDNLAYRLRIKTYKFLNSKRSKKISFQPRFVFSGTFKKNKKLVKKNEKRVILQYRLLSYFNFINTPKDYYLIKTKFHEITKNFRVPSFSYLEFQLSTSLLRANFFENGYIVQSLNKRGLFLINSSRVIGNSLVKPWDIITIAKPLWWLVYSRFINFFLSVSVSKTYFVSLKRKLIPKLFLKKVFTTRWLLRKFRNYKKLNTSSFKLTKIINAKNLILLLPPSYMEVSYKLLMFVIHKLVYKSSELTYSPSIKNLKYFIPNRFSSVGTSLKLAY